MARLDYRAQNPRWGFCGLVFENWESFSRTLGFLANIEHYLGHNGNTALSNSIELYIEQNHRQGAWGREGRIHYHRELNLLERELPDLNDARTAGVGKVVTRINSTPFVRDLVLDFNFQFINPPAGMTTITILPPETNPFDSVRNRLQEVLSQANANQDTINQCVEAYTNGWNL